MREQFVVEAVVQALSQQGFHVRTEVPNFYRSADVAAIDAEGDIWVIECKVSSMSRAIEQSKIHRLAADRVLVATPLRRTREETKNKLRCAGVGLIYVMPDGSVEEAYKAPRTAHPWCLARERLREAIGGQVA